MRCAHPDYKNRTEPVGWISAAHPPPAEAAQQPGVTCPHPLCPCREAQPRVRTGAAQHATARLHTRCGCLSGRLHRSLQRVPQRSHPGRASQAARSFAAGHGLGVAFFCLLFLARQEKKVRCRAHIPAKGMSKTNKPKNQQPKTSSNSIRTHRAARPHPGKRNIEKSTAPKIKTKHKPTPPDTAPPRQNRTIRPAGPP
mgnify:CR=1 FL=1